jgi:hypothetical protein
MRRAPLPLVLPLAALVLGAAGGCGAEGMMPPPGMIPMTLGSIHDDGSFAPLTDGQDVTLVEGSQGGFHVWMKFRVHGMPPGDVDIARTAHRADTGDSVLRTTGTITIGPPDANGDWELPMAATMFMCPTPIGVRVADERIVYEIMLSLGADEVSHASISLVPRCPAAQLDFCMKICTG